MDNSNWILWTIWSEQIRNKLNAQITTEELLQFIMDVVHRKDESFDVPSSNDANILIVKPRKITASTSKNEIHITGATFKPGEKVQGGKAWRLVATKDLATLLKSDSSLLSSTSLNDLFIVIGGVVNSSSRQVFLNGGTGISTKIIRFSNTATCLPGVIQNLTIKSFDCPYKNINIQNQIINIFKMRSKDYPGTIVLKTMCRKNKNLNNNNNHDCVQVSRPLHEIPKKKDIPVSRHESRESSPEVQIIEPSPPSSRSILQTSSNQNSSSSKIGKKKIMDKVNDNNNIPEKRLRTSGSTENNRRNDSMEIVVDDSPPPPLPRQNNNQDGIHNLGKQDRNYTYYTLEELEQKLIQLKCCTIHNANVWGIVESVIEVPTDDEFAGRRYPDNKPYAAKYVIRITDATKSNIFTRLCTGKSIGIRRFPMYKIGPRMEPLSIICIHRATVQYETTDSPLGKVREMVVSTTPHLNYTLFNHDPDINGEIIHERLADKPPEVTSKDIATIKSLRRLIINGSASQVHNTPRSQAQSILNTPSNQRQEQQQQPTSSVTILNSTVVVESHFPHAQTTPPAPNQNTQVRPRHVCHTSPPKNTNSQTNRRTLRSSQSLTPQNKQIQNVQDANSSLLNQSFLADAEESHENSLNNTGSNNNNGIERNNRFEISGDVLMDLEGDAPSNGNEQSNRHQDQSNISFPNLDLENSHESTTESYGSQEYTVEQAQFFCKLDKFSKTIKLPIKLEKIHSGRKTSFHLMCVVHKMMEIKGDKIVIRISDETVPLTEIKQFDELGNQEKLRDVPFVDLVVSNISKNPQVRERLEMCVATNRDMVLLHIMVNVTRGPNKSEIVQLVGDAEKIGAYWADQLP